MSGEPLIGERASLWLLCALVAAEAMVIVAIWDTSHWQPIPLLLVLAACVVVAEFGGVMIRGMAVSSSLLALLLTMALLGPVPAAALGGGVALLDRAIYRKPAFSALVNVFVFVAIGLAGGLAIEALVGSRPRSPGEALSVAVFGVGIGVYALNFLLVAGHRRLTTGGSLREAFRSTFMPTFPYQVVGIALAAAAVQAHAAGGTPALAGAVVALLVSELLLRSVAASQSHADELLAVSQERSDLLHASLIAEETERAWIAARLHDETLQTLAIVEQDLADADDDAAAIAAARRGLRAATHDLRQTLAHVHPAALDDAGLEPALRAYASQMGRRGPAFSVAVDPAVGRAQHALLYSLARELMLNAAKHAAAATVEVVVRLEEDAIRLGVSDDGRGFDPTTRAGVGHVGLATARRRTRAAGGDLEIESRPGEGTRVDLRLPLRETVVA